MKNVFYFTEILPKTSSFCSRDNQIDLLAGSTLDSVRDLYSIT